MKLSIDDRQRLAASVEAADNLGERPKTSWWLLTGAPGSGKTTLAHQFAAHGWPVVEDPGRAEFEANLLTGTSPDALRRDYLRFQHQVLQRALSTIGSTPPKQPTVFDYGVAEALAFMKLAGLPWDDFFVCAAARLYFERIFILDLVPIGKTHGDLIRAESLDKRMRLRDLIKELYDALGFKVTTVPLLEPGDRFRWVVDKALEREIDK